MSTRAPDPAPTRPPSSGQLRNLQITILLYSFAGAQSVYVDEMWRARGAGGDTVVVAQSEARRDPAPPLSCGGRAVGGSCVGERAAMGGAPFFLACPFLINGGPSLGIYPETVVVYYTIRCARNST